MDLLAFLENRATVRQYSDKEVSKELINRLLEVAGHASTTGNMQLYSVVVTRDAEKKKALAPTHFNQPTFTNAPVVITFCADFNRFVKWCEELLKGLRKRTHRTVLYAVCNYLVQSVFLRCFPH